MHDLRVLVEYLADAVATVFANHAISLGFGMRLDGVADIAQMRARAHLVDAEPHAFIRHLSQTLRQDRTFADDEHAAGIAEVVILDDGDVDVQGVAVLERFVAGNAVTDHVVDRDAGGLGVGRITGRLIVQRCRHGALLLEHVFVAKPVELPGRDTGAHMRRNEIEHLAGQSAGDAHHFNIVGILEGDGHC